MKRDRAETIVPARVWVPATEVVNRLSSSSSKQLHSHLLISYSCDAIKTAAPGIRPSLQSKGGGGIFRPDPFQQRDARGMLKL